MTPNLKGANLCKTLSTKGRMFIKRPTVPVIRIPYAVVAYYINRMISTVALVFNTIGKAITCMSKHCQ